MSQKCEVCRACSRRDSRSCGEDIKSFLSFQAVLMLFLTSFTWGTKLFMSKARSALYIKSELPTPNLVFLWNFVLWHLANSQPTFILQTLPKAWISLWDVWWAVTRCNSRWAVRQHCKQRWASSKATAVFLAKLLLQILIPSFLYSLLHAF